MHYFFPGNPEQEPTLYLHPFILIAIPPKRRRHQKMLLKKSQRKKKTKTSRKTHTKHEGLNIKLHEWRLSPSPKKTT